jgi:replicative DNA helicase Mcm
MTASVLSSVSKWKEFLARYYKSDIQMLALSKNKTLSLLVSFKHLNKYDYLLSEELVKNPDLCLAHADDAVPLVDIPIKLESTIKVRPINLTKHIRIRDIRTDEFNKLLSIECTIQNIAPVCDKCNEAAFECARCKAIIRVPQDDTGRWIEPAYCSCNEERKGAFRQLEREMVMSPYQKVRVQENPEDLAGDEQPRTIDVNLMYDLADSAKPGERIVLTGILRRVQRFKNNQKTAFFDYYIDAVAIEHEEIAFEDLEISAEDEQRIISYSQMDNPVQIVADCIAPWIYGVDHVKMGLAGQLFGGVRKVLPGGMTIRGDIHIAWWGDPGMAKTEAIQDVADNLAPRGTFSSGLGITGVGLTAATIKDDFGEGYSIRAGVLALMNGGGIAAIDEFGRMQDHDREKMHTAMEQQRIPIDKAGFHTTLRSECSVLAAGNPKDGRWDLSQPPADQIGIDRALATRFDITYISIDTPNEKNDTKIAETILNSVRKAQSYTNKKNTGKQLPLDSEAAIQTPIPREDLKKWIAYARRKIFPVLTDDAEQRLKEFYLELRSNDPDSEIVRATPRQLQGPNRLSEAYARIRLSQTVELQDVEQAISVIRASLRDLPKNNDGKFDYDEINVGSNKSQRERRASIIKVISQLNTDNNSGAQLTEIVSKCVELKIMESHVNSELKILKEIGEVWISENDNGYWVSKRSS